MEDDLGNSRLSRHGRREAEARAALRRIDAETETVAASQLARFADRLRVATTANPPANAPEDGIERWGRRIARLLALLVAAGLVVHLYATYAAR